MVFTSLVALASFVALTALVTSGSLLVVLTPEGEDVTFVFVDESVLSNVLESLERRDRFLTGLTISSSGHVRTGDIGANKFLLSVSLLDFFAAEDRVNIFSSVIARKEKKFRMRKRIYNGKKTRFFLRAISDHHKFWKIGLTWYG